MASSVKLNLAVTIGFHCKSLPCRDEHLPSLYRLIFRYLSLARGHVVDIHCGVRKLAVGGWVHTIGMMVEIFRCEIAQLDALCVLSRHQSLHQSLHTLSLKNEGLSMSYEGHILKFYRGRIPKFYKGHSKHRQ